MKTAASKRSLFLIEIGILLFFFLFASVVCVSLFVSANTKNTQANDLNSSVIKAISIGDTIKACTGDMAETKKRLSASSSGKSGFSIYYDKDWNPVKKENSRYHAFVRYSMSDHLLTATITLASTKENREIYKLNVQQFVEGI